MTDEAWGFAYLLVLLGWAVGVAQVERWSGRRWPVAVKLLPMAGLTLLYLWLARGAHG